MIVKVCGMRDAQNIKDVESLGIGMMGFIFYRRSPRFCEGLPAYLPSRCKRVGVFVNSNFDEIKAKQQSFQLHYIQLHGNETPAFANHLREALNVKVIKAFSITSPFPAGLIESYEGACDLFLFDTPTTSFGGSGRTFDHALLSDYRGNTPFLLSGGIGLSNASEFTGPIHPLCIGVDLNSRFEAAPGLKDVALLRQFLNTIRIKDSISQL